MNKLHLKNRYLGMLDIFVCFIAYFLVYLLLLSMDETFDKFFGGVPFIALIAVVYSSFLAFFSVYHTDWVYAGAKEYLRLILACICSIVISVLLQAIIPNKNVSFKLNLAANIGNSVFVCLCRFMVRLVYNIAGLRKGTDKKRALVIGAGSLAMAFVRDVAHNDKLDYEIVGLIDDDKTKQNLCMHGTKVIGTRKDIERLCKEKDVEEIIFAIYTLKPNEKADILDICSKTGKKVKIIHGLAANINDFSNVNKLRELNIEDLLEREAVKLDNELISGDICGKTVLVTGAGGSIGSELCRQIVKFNPARLVILDIYENTTYDLQNELEENYPDLDLVTLIASVRDKKRLSLIFEEYHPDVVFHAAAHKHVPLMEDSPCEAIKNNVVGTYNTALCAKEYEVQSFVLISTDKAVNPTNIMGASKRMCEMIIQTLQKYSKTEFVAVRFGNVLGSNGSVIPRFKKQIDKGGPVTVTHPEITRFFMTIPEAAQLVLQAAAYAKGGEIFVLDMGQPVKIRDLAEKMIRLSGYTPNEEIKIEYTGLRPGEKLYEELLMNEEGLEGTEHKKIFIGKPVDMEISELEEKIERLKSVVDEDNETIKKIMAEVVPTYEIYHSTNQTADGDKQAVCV